MVVELCSSIRESLWRNRGTVGQLLRWEVANCKDGSKRKEKMIRVYLRNIYDEMEMNDLECSLEERNKKVGILESNGG